MHAIYYIVTDLWFDPVIGQSDPIAGQMVGYSMIMSDGSIHKCKSSTTIRGLASQQFHYSDIDFIALAKTRAGVANVVGIGHANTIRKRPKIPGL